MTRGTVHQFDPRRGTGFLCCIAGTLVPFSSRDRALQTGDEVTFRLTGGITGLYALHVRALRGQPAAAGQHQTATSSSPFRFRSGTVASAAG